MIEKLKWKLVSVIPYSINFEWAKLSFPLFGRWSPFSPTSLIFSISSLFPCWPNSGQYDFSPVDLSLEFIVAVFNHCPDLFYNYLKFNLIKIMFTIKFIGGNHILVFLVFVILIKCLNAIGLVASINWRHLPFVKTTRNQFLLVVRHLPCVGITQRAISGSSVDGEGLS